MTGFDTPSAEELEQLDSQEDDVVRREDDEGVILQAYVITGSATEEISARTYTRSMGRYIVPPQTKPTELLDELFRDYTAENSILNNFERCRGEAFEVVVELADVTETDAHFRGMNEVELQLPSHSQYIEEVDDFLAEVRSNVSAE